MAFIFSRSGLLILLSCIAFALSIMFAWFYLAWVCLAPLFITVYPHRGVKAFRSGALFGLGFGAVLLYWMPSLIADFTGTALPGIVIYGAGIVIAMLYYGLLTWATAWFPKDNRPVAMNALWVASVWTLGEWLLSTALPGMPWFGLFRVSNTILDNLYAIQAAELGGAYLLSFFVVLVNCLLAHYCRKRQWKMLTLPFAVVLLYMIAGYGLFARFQQQHPRSGKPLSVAILCDNTAPDVKWNKENGSFLVQRLLDLNLKGAATRPDIALWTESVVPWTYRTDDDFIKEVLKATAPYNITHVMGMTSDYTDKEIYNSAYCLLPDGKVLGRYDKHYPVSLAEKPMGSLALSLGGNDARLYEKEGTSLKPLPTPYGKAGVLICNDATVPGATVNQVKHGAVFLLSLSNDAWFSHVPYLVRQHFLNTRLRAVEVRKDMAINCNMGTSGLVRADGALQLAPTEGDSFVANVPVYDNKFLTSYTLLPLLFIYVIIALMFIFILLNVLQTKKPNVQ